MLTRLIVAVCQACILRVQKLFLVHNLALPAMFEGAFQFSLFRDVLRAVVLIGQGALLLLCISLCQIVQIPTWGLLSDGKVARARAFQLHFGEGEKVERGYIGRLHLLGWYLLLNNAYSLPTWLERVSLFL